MKKQIATTLIAASMLASLCSCGNNAAAGTTAAETQAAETTAAQTEETAAETTEAATAAAETTATTTTAAQTTATETEEEEEDNTLYAAVGTGMKKPDGYTPEPIESRAEFYTAEAFIERIKDDDVKSSVSAEIEKAKKGFEDNGIPWENVSCEVFLRNGYASVEFIEQRDYIEDCLGEELCYDFAYDMFGNKKIENYSDLFFEGEDFVPVLNEWIGKRMCDEISVRMTYNENGDMNVLGNYEKAALDYKGYDGIPEIFTADSIMLNKNNPFSDDYVRVRLSDYNDLNVLMVTSVYRDMSELFNDSESTVLDFCREMYETVNTVENGVSYMLVKSPYVADERINTINEALKKGEVKLREFLDSIEVSEGVYKPSDFIAVHINDNYVSFQTEPFAVSAFDVVMDIDTGKFLEPQDIFGENWMNFVVNDDMIGDKYEKAWLSGYYNGNFLVTLYTKDLLTLTGIGSVNG